MARMGSGGWIQRRFALIAGVGFSLALVVVLLAAAGGPAAAILGLAAITAGGWAFFPQLKKSLAAREQRRQQLLERAQQQHRWAARGDLRGVYGAEGAELMRTVTPPQPIVPPGADLEVAGVVHTAAELTDMLEKKPPCWRYAAFVSVLVQRRHAMRDSVLDARTGFAAAAGRTLRSELETGLFFTDRFAELCRLTEQIDGFMFSGAFQGVFGDREESADADGIVHAANRLMDYHDQLLTLNQQCREVAVPQSCAELRRDMTGLTLLPINGFHSFIDTFVERVKESAEVARYATGDVQLDAVTLRMSDDDHLIERVAKRLKQIAANG